MKKVFISGSVFSVDPVRSVGAYAYKTFSDVEAVNYWLDEENPKEIHFTVIRPQFVEDNATVADITDGLFLGDDRNVTWKLEYTKA